MIHRPLSRLAALCAAASLAACGGGGGGGSVPSTQPTPLPTPTLAPSCHAFSPQSGLSQYTLTSNPSGVQVERVNALATQCVYLNAITPANDAPGTAPNTWRYIFAPTSASPYTIDVAQTLNGPHTIFYNQAGDSSGTVNVSSIQALHRSPQSVRSVATGARRSVQRFTGAGVLQSEVFVRFRGEASQARANAGRILSAEGARGATELTSVRGEYERFVRVPAGTDAATFAARLRTHSDVAAVFPAHKRFALGRRSALTIAPTHVSDPHFVTPDQWYLFADGFPNAWSYGPRAAAKIAIIDTGIDLANSDLTPNLEYSIGYHSMSPQGQDTNGHGTNVAGIADAVTNDAVGFAGAAYNVKMLMYNIFPDATATSDKQEADSSDEVAAINDAVARSADVINLSLGGASDYGTDNGFDQGEHDAVEAAIAAGVTIVAAAGNDADGGESGTPHVALDYPAGYDNVIAVGASALKDNDTGNYATSTEFVAPYSQYGPGLGLVAPGGSVSGDSDTNALHWIWNYSTSTAAYPADQCKTKDPVTDCTAFFEGTSQATPQVSAAAALLVAAAGGHHVLSPARIAQLLESTADNINDPHQGHGRLNIYKALAALKGDVGAYSGPSPQTTSPTQLVAFAYQNSGGTTPQILDANYPQGVPVDGNGNFRLGDVPAGAGTYRVGVWYDANGDGVIDAGDQFGTAPTACNAAAKCAIGTITMTVVAPGFTLP